MIRSSIRTKILAIAVGMIVLMVITAVLSLTLVTQVGHRLEQMTNSYIPAYGNLARGNIRSLERALALRRMVIAKSPRPACTSSPCPRSQHWENRRLRYRTGEPC